MSQKAVYKMALKRLAMGLLLCVGFSPAVSARTNIVVMLGDSTTLCSRNKPGARLTDFIQAYLTRTQHAQVAVVNAGKGGDTVKGGYARLQAEVLAHAPDFVTISFGLNDTGLLEPGEYREHLEKIIVGIEQKSRARILLVTSTPFNNARHTWGKKFSAKGGLDEYMDARICAQMRSLAQKYGLPVCDLHACFKQKFKRDPALIDTLILPDGVHLTDEGNSAAAEFLAPAIAALIGGTSLEQTNPPTAKAKP